MKTEPCPDCGGERRYVPATDSHPAHLSCLTCIRRAVEDDHEPGIGDRTRDLLFGLMTVAAGIADEYLAACADHPAECHCSWCYNANHGEMRPHLTGLRYNAQQTADLMKANVDSDEARRRLRNPFAGGGGVVIGSQLSMLASYADHIGRAAGWEPDPGFAEGKGVDRGN